MRICSPSATAVAFALLSNGLTGLPATGQTISPAPAIGDSTATIAFSIPLSNEETHVFYSHPNSKTSASYFASSLCTVALRVKTPATAEVNSKNLVLITDKPQSQGAAPWLAWGRKSFIERSFTRALAVEVDE